MNYIFECVRPDAEQILMIVPADTEETAWYYLGCFVKNTGDFKKMS